VEPVGAGDDDPHFEDSEDFDESEDFEREDVEEEEGGPVRRAPWHFKLLAVGTVIYLGWRAYQGIGWLVHHV
jgi:hypothetical protein